LYGNQLTELPQSIGNLTNLTTLSLSDNQLTKLPESIGNLTNLEILYLDYNQLTELPESIGNLTNLEQLWLGDNAWQKPVPKEIILKMIRNRVHKRVIKEIIDMNNSIPTKSNLRLR
jgi:internalin A